MAEGYGQFRHGYDQVLAVDTTTDIDWDTGFSNTQPTDPGFGFSGSTLLVLPAELTIIHGIPANNIQTVFSIDWNYIGYPFTHDVILYDDSMNVVDTLSKTYTVDASTSSLFWTTDYSQGGTARPSLTFPTGGFILQKFTNNWDFNVVTSSGNEGSNVCWGPPDSSRNWWLGVAGWSG